jgi:hypothetical protein
LATIGDRGNRLSVFDIDTDIRGASVSVVAKRVLRGAKAILTPDAKRTAPCGNTRKIHMTIGIRLAGTRDITNILSSGRNRKTEK